MTAPVRLSDLPPAGRGIVLALLQAERAARRKKTGPTNETSGPVATGGTSDADRAA